MSIERRIINFNNLFTPEGVLGITAAADSYKMSHFLQYRPDIRRMVSYIESRGYDKVAQIVSPEMKSALNVLGPDIAKKIVDDATMAAPEWTHTVFFGFQMFAKKFLNARVTVEMVKETAALAKAHGVPFPEEGFLLIATELQGKLPLRIRTVAEGTVLPLKNAMVVVENTDDRFPWLVSYVETALLRAIWYPVTVATLSFNIKLDIYKALVETCENPDAEIMFKLHDFGARGVSSQESAMIGGAAHIVNFMGSDTVEGIIAAMKYYNLPFMDQMPAFSIPAAEHSTITSWGGPKYEPKAFKNMIDKFGSGPLFAVVSDSYSLRRAVQEYWGETFKGAVLETGNTLVVRPDSGDPTVIPVETVKWLSEKYGFTVNSKGYKVLPKSVRVIQGDGVNQRTIRIILKNLTNPDNRFSAENIAFGMGGALLQQVNRDTLKFAMKACASRIEIGANPEIGNPDGMDNDGWFDVFKDPETDKGKKSKAGRMALVQTGPVDFETVPLNKLNGRTDMLKTVWLNGELVDEVDFVQVRERAQAGFNELFSRKKR